MQIKQDDDEVRRQYWIEQMEYAHDFMNNILAYPVEECGETLVYLPKVAEEENIGVIFSPTMFLEKYKRFFYLRKGLIKHFISVAKEMNSLGWTLKVEDGFRSLAMQKEIALQNSIFDNLLQKVIWEKKGEIPDAKLMLRRLTALVATSPKNGTHMSASAMDISVLETNTLSEVERGAHYLELSELTPMDSPFISSLGQKNRISITEIMQKYGFIAYPYEFWHYSQGDVYLEYLTKSGKPARYGAINFDVATGEVAPIANSQRLLHSLSDIEKHIKRSLDRLH